MKGFEHIKKIKEYCDYLEEHLSNMSSAWEIIKTKCYDLDVLNDPFHYKNINNLILDHDLSKFSKEEFIPYRDKYYPVLDNPYNERDYYSAWENHLINNPHHWENWTNLNYDNNYEWKYHCLCMICDWVAMGLKFNDTALNYYEKNKEKIHIPEYAKSFLYKVLNKV